jgi:hypothetical protein
MTIQIELDPETEARLSAEAGRRGIAPERYAGDFLRENLPQYATGTGKLLPGDVDKMTKVMTAGSENLPILPPEVNDRESYYEDRW